MNRSPWRGAAAGSIVGVTLAAIGLCPALAAAQATTVVTPSVGVGAVYDSNIVWRPEGLGDRVYRVSPRLAWSRETRRSLWDTDLLVDSEWFTGNAELSTPLARQHAATKAQWTLSPRSILAVNAAYENSMTPQEIALATRLTPGRTRAWTWLASPELTHRVGARTALDARYEITRDSADGYPGALSHDSRARVDWKVTERGTLRVGYRERVFIFDVGGVTRSHSPLAGVEYRVTPAISLVADGGVRVTNGQMRPEIDAQLTRHSTFVNATLAYTWTQATSPGFGTLIDVQRVNGRLGYEWPKVLQASIDGGFYLNDIGPARADVYHAGGEVIKHLAGALSLGATYTLDFQRGRPGLVGARAAGTGAADTTVPDLLRPNTGSDRIVRHVLMVRVLIASPIRSASGPPEPPPTQPGQLPAPASGRTR